MKSGFYIYELITLDFVTESQWQIDTVRSYASDYVYSSYNHLVHSLLWIVHCYYLNESLKNNCILYWGLAY